MSAHALGMLPIQMDVEVDRRRERLVPQRSVAASAHLPRRARRSLRVRTGMVLVRVGLAVAGPVPARDHRSSGFCPSA